MRRINSLGGEAFQLSETVNSFEDKLPEIESLSIDRKLIN